MAYGNLNVDVVQSSTAGTPTQFNDGNGTQVGTLCRAWVRFTGSTAVIASSFNVTSVTRNGTGDYTVNFTNALPDANYSAVGTVNYQAALTLIQANCNSSGTEVAPTTTAFRFITITTSSTSVDAKYVNVSIFR